MVTAVARRPSAVAIQHERLEVIQGDVLEPATIAQPITGQEVVVSAFGAAARAPTTLYSEGAANIIRAMQTANVRRLIGLSANGLEPGPILQRWFAKPLLWRAFRHTYTDLVRMEAVIKASGLDWTILRPPRLTNGPRTGRYDVAVNKPLTYGWSISRADLADYIVTHLDDPASHRAMVEIAY